MALAPLFGHEVPRNRIADAIASGRLPQVLLITGAKGVGRQRFGLWVAQMLFCERPEGEPCGRCRGCHLVLGLSHADLHWFIPIPRPKAGDPDRQVDEAAEALAELVSERARTPLWQSPDGMAIHGVASARLLQRKAALRPVEGHRQVFLIGDAERLVPQESSPEAANSLLKLLEEPAPHAVVILTAEEAGGILPTIRSRAVPLRLGRLDDGEVRAFLKAHTDLAPGLVDDRVLAAEGAIGRGLAEDGAAAKATEAASTLLEAVVRGPPQSLELALKQGPWQARGEFTEMLDALSRMLGDAARVATGTAPRRPLPAALRKPRRLDRVVAAQAQVQATRQAAQGNVNPQILLAGLCNELAAVL